MLPRITRIITDLHGFAWRFFFYVATDYTDLHGFTRICTDLHGLHGFAWRFFFMLPRIYTDLHGLRGLHGLNGFTRITRINRICTAGLELEFVDGQHDAEHPAGAIVAALSEGADHVEAQ